MKPYRVISADSHAIEPPDLWQQYLPQALRDRGPRVVAEADGDVWVCEGMSRRAAKRPMGAVARNQTRAYAAAGLQPGARDAAGAAWRKTRLYP